MDKILSLSHLRYNLTYLQGNFSDDNKRPLEQEIIEAYQALLKCYRETQK